MLQVEESATRLAFKLQIWDLKKLDILRETQERALPLLKAPFDDDIDDRDFAAVASDLYDSPVTMRNMLCSHLDEDMSGVINVDLLVRQAASTIDRIKQSFETARKTNLNKKVAINLDFKATF